MVSNLSTYSINTNKAYWYPQTVQTDDQTADSSQNNSQNSVLGGNELIYNSLNNLALQNQVSLGNTNTQASVSKVAEMLQSGNKQEVKDKLGASAIPALTAIVKDTKQPMQVRVDAIATLAKLVDEGKAPASCLVSLLKDPNCKDMAERALANVGKEALPAVKDLLKSSDPSLKESAKNILNDMLDAWQGYENDPKWGAECQELIPEVQNILKQVNGDTSNANTSTSSASTESTAENTYSTDEAASE